MKKVLTASIYLLFVITSILTAYRILITYPDFPLTYRENIFSFGDCVGDIEMSCDFAVMSFDINWISLSINATLFLGIALSAQLLMFDLLKYYFKRRSIVNTNNNHTPISNDSTF